MSRGRKRNKDMDTALNLALWVLGITFAMPIVGGYLLFNGKTPTKVGLGLILLILGIAVWVMLL